MFVSVFISLIIGSTAYSYVTSNGKILGESTHVVKVPKELLMFYHEPQLPGYYELASSQTYTDTTDWAPGSATYSLNLHGMNDVQDYTKQKPKDTLRIMAIGDSFTFGQFINTEDNYPKRLLSLLSHSHCNRDNPIEVLNLGVPGYDIQYTVEHFDRVGKQFNPDIVVWLVNEHNVYQIKEKIASISAELTSKASEQETKTYLSEGNYYWAIKKATELLVLQNGKTGIFEAQKNHLNRFASIYDGKLLIVMFDDADQSAKNVLREFAEQRPNSYFSANLPNLARLNATLPDLHPNIYGHTVIATYIYQQLNDLQLVQCSR